MEERPEKISRTEMSSHSREKLALLRGLLREEGVECILVTQTHHFAWLTGGRSFVPMNTESGVSQLFVDESRAVVVTTSIEKDRMEAEESPGFEVLGADWRELPASLERLVTELTRGRTLERDTGRLAGKLEDLQTQLTEGDVAAYRELGADCGCAIAEVARSLRAGDSEYAVAGRLASALLARAVDPVLLLVAFDERISQHRHPLPTRAELAKTALLVLGGRRHGVIVSVSRVICLGPVPAELRQKHDAVSQVDAELILGTCPGRTGDELFELASKAYADRGFGEEIAKHHQGGLTGFKTRYWKAAPGVAKQVVGGCCYAWNPSITGTKSEDTIYVPRDGGKPEVLSASPEWPMINVELLDGRSLPRADILVL